MFLAVQAVATAFLLLHDWVKLGRLNDLESIARMDSLSHRIFVTLLPGIPAAAGLAFSAIYFRRPYPDALAMLLWITYGVLLAGLLRAWWIPYLLIPEPARAARYQTLFARTHTFLPPRNGISPNTLHVIFHLATLTTLVLLFFRNSFVPTP